MKKEEKKAKEAFSRYVRLRDSMETTGSTAYCKCFTCNEIVSFDQIQCGHFISGRGNSLFFEENNSRGQCPECNTSKGGNPEIYREKMINKYGIEEVERLESLRHVPVKIRESEFSEYFFKFREEYKRLLES